MVYRQHRGKHCPQSHRQAKREDQAEKKHQPQQSTHRLCEVSNRTEPLKMRRDFDLRASAFKVGTRHLQSPTDGKTPKTHLILLALLLLSQSVGHNSEADPAPIIITRES